MAKPRIFLSSTFYDLRHVRGELDRFIRDMGYEPILNERGNIPYGADEALEKYCYQEVEKASMLVSIIGGRYGSISKEAEQYSVSNMELKVAIEQGKQVYIFIDSSVLSEYRTYQINKDAEINYHHVDNVKIYSFIDEIFSLPKNNQIQGFSSIPEITAHLREQWAGLFENFLQQESQQRIVRLADTIQSTAQTLKGLVELLRNDDQSVKSSTSSHNKALDALILQNHPIFTDLRRELNVPYRVFFTNIVEMDDWMRGRGIEKVDRELWDSDNEMEYSWGQKKARRLLYVNKRAFDGNGSLKVVLPGTGDQKFVRSKSFPEPRLEDNDEIPF